MAGTITKVAEVTLVATKVEATLVEVRVAVTKVAEIFLVVPVILAAFLMIWTMISRFDRDI
jgi:hypothetical protein